jgi:hypothetical protein
LTLVQEWLVKIAGGENPELDLRNLRTVLRDLLALVKPDTEITEAVDEVFEAALAYQGEFAHATKAGAENAYHFLLRGAERMERSLAVLRCRLGTARPTASKNGW